MSHHATSWAFTAPKGMPTVDKFVLVALADFADSDGICYPSWSKLAKMTNLHRATVYRSLDRLVRQWGCVQVITSGGLKTGNRGRHANNRYRLDVGPWRLPAEMGDHEVATTFDPEVLDPELSLFTPFLEPESEDEVIHKGRGARPINGSLRVAHGDKWVAHDDKMGRGARPEVTNEPSRTAPSSPYFEGTAVDNSDTAWRRIPDETRQSGLAHIAALRDQLASRSSSTDALEADGAE